MSHPALEVVLTVLRHQVDDLVRIDAAVRDDAPESIHDLRTAVRRLRTTLAAGRPVLDRAVTDALRERLGEFGAALEPARDAEVREELAGELTEAGGTAEAAAATTTVRDDLATSARADYERGRAALLSLMDRPDHADLIADLAALVERPPLGAKAFGGQRPVLHRALGREARRAHRRLEGMDDSSLETLHDARKAVRRVRYLAEAIEQYAPGDTAASVVDLGQAARGLQDLLGDHRDAVLHARWIARAAATAERAGDNPEAYRRLERIEHDRAGDLIAARAAAVTAFEQARDRL